MKKALSLLLFLALFAVGTAVAEESATPANVVKTYGVSKVCDAYHQLIALIAEYPKDVVAPSPEDYSVIDYDTVEYPILSSWIGCSRSIANHGDCT